MRRYYLHKRNNGIFYAELVNPETGLKLTAKSTGTKSRDEALLKIAEWLKSGIPTGRIRKPRTLEAAAGIESILRAMRKTDLDADDALRIVRELKDRGLIDIAAVKSGKGTVSFVRFLEEFWDYEASPYIREKLAHGHSIGKRHCYESMSRFRRYWEPAFINKSLNSITRQDLKEFSLSLADNGLAPASINKIMTVGTTCLSWAFREGLIAADPTIGLVNFSGESKKRGVLTPLEAQALFASKWKDKRAYAASLLACTTGMRTGEVLALKQEDIGERALNVRHSYSAYDGLKSPKNGEARRVPLLPEVRGKLLELARDNPYGPEGFIFYGSLTDKPIDSSVLLDGLQDALAGIGIDAKERGIVFHSWRHYYAARMADRMTADQVSRVTGHKSRAVYDAYADHIIAENLEEVGRVGAEVFGNILKFRDVV
ncbi:MAG: tyrosine-type recombinase/integrase [Treponema sp.]|nr:tyrosine-type recombinase/integrase [Treponema sp.]